MLRERKHLLPLPLSVNIPMMGGLPPSFKHQVIIFFPVTGLQQDKRRNFFGSRLYQSVLSAGWKMLLESFLHLLEDKVLFSICVRHLPKSQWNTEVWWKLTSILIIFRISLYWHLVSHWKQMQVFWVKIQCFTHWTPPYAAFDAVYTVSLLWASVLVR